jgi:hypothetical protein
MSKKRTPRVRKIAIDPNPKGNLKAIGGAEHDDWNNWLASATAAALPVNQNDEANATKATVAAYSGMIDMKPADPIEGILISQLIAASQTSLSLYQRAWALPSEHLSASEISRARRQSGSNGRDAHGAARPSSRARAAADHRQTLDR